MTSTQTERLSTGNPEKKSLRCLKTTVGRGKLSMAEQVESSLSNPRAGFYIPARTHSHLWHYVSKIIFDTRLSHKYCACICPENSTHYKYMRLLAVAAGCVFEHVYVSVSHVLRVAPCPLKWLSINAPIFTATSSSSSKL